MVVTEQEDELLAPVSKVKVIGKEIEPPASVLKAVSTEVDALTQESTRFPTTEPTVLISEESAIPTV